MWGSLVRFRVGLSVEEVGQVVYPFASKASGFDGVPDSFPSSFASPLPSDFSPPRKTKSVVPFLWLVHFKKRNKNISHF
jgi:hypothetical protein